MMQFQTDKTQSIAITVETWMGLTAHKDILFPTMSKKLFSNTRTKISSRRRLQYETYTVAININYPKRKKIQQNNKPDQLEICIDLSNVRKFPDLIDFFVKKEI